MMKKMISMLSCLAVMLSLAINVSAVDQIDLETGMSKEARAVELQQEKQAAEEILGGKCKVESQEVQQVENYVVETRLYILDEVNARSNSGECGGLSSHTWRKYGSDEWDIKVLFSAFFYYNGTTAICRQDETSFWAINPDNSIIHKNFNEEFTYSDGATAKARCQYAMDVPGSSTEPIIYGNLKVTCTKTGVIGYENDNKRYF